MTRVASCPPVMTEAMKKALANAAGRERGNVCPVGGVHAAAETALLAAMSRRGFIQWDGEVGWSVPRISPAGRQALEQSEQ